MVYADKTDAHCRQCKVMFVSVVPHYLARFDQVSDHPFVEEYVLPTTTIFWFPLKHFSHER